MAEQTVGAFLDEHRFGREFRAVVPAADDRVHLVVPGRTDAGLPGRHADPLLPQPWPAADRRSPAMDDGARRLATIRAPHRRSLARRPAEHAGAGRQARSRPARWSRTANGTEHFEQIVFACHSDQTLRLLGADATPAEAAGARRDPVSAEPGRTAHRRIAAADAAFGVGRMELRILECRRMTRRLPALPLNRLQPLPWQQPVIVSLNPLREPRAETVIQRFDYDHPVFDVGAIAAQRRLSEIQGQRRSLVLRCVGRLRLSRRRAERRHGRRRSAGRRQARGAAARRRVSLATTTHRLRPRLAPTAAPGAARVRLPSYFLLLPMRALRARPNAGLRRNRFGALSFFDRDHGDGRDDSLAWLDELLAARAHRRRAGRSLAAHLSTRARLRLQPGELLVCAPHDGSLAAVVAEVNNTFGERHCYLLSGPALRWGRPLEANKVFHVSPFCAVEGRYRFRFLLERRRRQRRHATRWPASTTTTPTARCCRPASAARSQPLNRRQHLPRLLRHAADDIRRRRPHSLAGTATGPQARALSSPTSSPRPLRHTMNSTSLDFTPRSAPAAPAAARAVLDLLSRLKIGALELRTARRNERPFRPGHALRVGSHPRLERLRARPAVGRHRLCRGFHRRRVGLARPHRAADAADRQSRRARARRLRLLVGLVAVPREARS